ncbi:MAG: site-2 protease family protein [Isosphaeraceae bacterium]
MTSPTTKTLANATPILDREAPLPPRTAPGSGLRVLLTVWIGAALVVAACWLLDRPPILRQWFVTDFRPWLRNQCAEQGIVGVGLSALAAFYLMLAVHELGHVAAGLCVGFRLRSMRVGPLLFSRPFRVSLYRGPGAVVNGVAELFPVAADKLAWRGVAMVLGGPVANFLTVMVVLVLPFPITVFSGLLIACSIANGVNDLFPFESRLGVSDGKRIGILLRQPERGERWLALLHLGGQIADGVLPEALSAEFLAKAIAVRDASADTVKAYALAFSAAFHQHKDREAGQHLETCLAYSGHAAPALREALRSDAAVYLARKRKRGDLAAQWLAEIPVKAPNAWFRSRAEAAILEAKGDVEGALNKLAETETSLRALPKNAQRETLLRLLLRWKSELCRS